MHLLVNFKIKYKLLIMLLLPILSFLYFTANVVIERAITAKNMAALEQLTELSIEFSKIIHTIQIERDHTLLALDGKNNQAIASLSEEYTNVNTLIAELEVFIEKFDFSYYPTDFRQKVDNILVVIKKLPSIRKLVVLLKVQSQQISYQYANLNAQILDFITTVDQLDNTDSRMFNYTRIYANLLVIKEKASLENSLGRSILTQQHATPEQYRQLIELIAYQNIYLNRNILLHLDTEQKTFFEQMLVNPIIKDVETMRHNFYTAMEDETKLQQISVTHWTTKQDERIVLLQTIGEQIATNLHDSAVLLQIKAKQEFNIILFIAILIMMVVIVFTIFIIKNITNPLKKAVLITKAIAQRNLDNDIQIKGKDEISQLLQALAEMQNQLRIRLEEEKNITQQALRINSALDNATTNVLIANNQFKIIYLNRAAQQLFKVEESKLRSQLPNFDMSHLLHSNVDQYHKKPQHQHQILSNLVGTHRSRVVIGGVTLDHIITPIDDEQGERLGFVIEFHNRSSEVSIEQEINQVIQAASQGDFKQRINLEGKTGFFKIFGESINRILEVNQLAISDTVRIFAALARGNLTETITRDYTGTFEQLKNDANATIQKLTEVVATIQQTANAVDNAATDISNGNISLTQRTEEQAASLEQTAASMEQMTSTVQQNADNARQASQLALSAKEYAEQGGKVVNAAVVAVSAINSSSQKVTDIIGVINDIAFQTNLLALNAAVEAARAGEQGRGFAVVAAEVRHLAQRSATAAKEIKNLIRDSVDKVEEGTKLVNQSGNTLEDIMIAVKKVSDIIGEISAASQEQSASIHQVNKAITQMDEMTQQNASLVSQAVVANNVMVEQVKTLKQQIAFFKVKENQVVEKKKKTASPVISTKKVPVVTTHKEYHDHEQGWEDF